VDLPVADSSCDLVIIGAGSGGLVAAAFAVQLGARVTMIEKNRIGGDCTWTGCVPSKALLKAAKIAQEVRTARHYGIETAPPVADMRRVRDYVQSAIEAVYQYETPEELNQAGIDAVVGQAHFLDPHTVQVGEHMVRSNAFLITTGGHAFIPPIPGLDQVRFITYEQIFENDHLPQTLTVIGAGPIGMEMAQAYRRLGSEVTIIDEHVLPKDEPEAQDVIRRVFEREGIRFVIGRVNAVRSDGDKIAVFTAENETRGEMLLVAVGRRPTVHGLDLEKAGVKYSDKGIPVDDHLRTNMKHIYAAGDVVGGYQFTHLAAWQAFQAVRNALLPGHTSGGASVVPWVTYTDPEVAHAGLTEEQARKEFGNDIDVHRWSMGKVDRAVCENDTDGFIKVLTKKGGSIIGATIVAARAGEMISEIVLGIENGWWLKDIAGAIHAYPTYSVAIQQLASAATVEQLLSGTQGRIIRGLSKWIR
jgi:pyruvate/2-oxoglutarate dehydrogenase complex dihydrolipoamide dehydrogenase (E3) component